MNQTPHRWNGRPREGAWLLAFRERLRDQPPRRPAGMALVEYPHQHGINGALSSSRSQCPGCFERGESVAVLVRENADLPRSAIT